MNKLKLKFILASELKKMNRMIDLKIARGLSYRHEARRHKTIVRQLDNLSRDFRDSRERTFAFF